MGQSHLYELVPMLAANELSILAVTDADGQYQGIIEQKSINKLIADSFTYRGMGAILVLLHEMIEILHPLTVGPMD